MSLEEAINSLAEQVGTNNLLLEKQIQALTQLAEAGTKTTTRKRKTKEEKEAEEAAEAAETETPPSAETPATTPAAPAATAPAPAEEKPAPAAQALDVAVIVKEFLSVEGEYPERQAFAKEVITGFGVQGARELNQEQVAQLKTKLDAYAPAGGGLL